jgi:type I restriction enzyme, R subunit
MAYLSEAAVEKMVLEQLQDLGYTVAPDKDIGPDGKASERESYGDVLLIRRLVAAIEKLNPNIPSVVQRDALRKIRLTEKPALIDENCRLHKMIVEGVDVEYYDEDGTIRGDKVRLIDFDDLDANDWTATGQFTVIEGRVNRRADVVVFVNGLPLGVIELKGARWRERDARGRAQPASDL